MYTQLGSGEIWATCTLAYANGSLARKDQPTGNRRLDDCSVNWITLEAR